MKGAIWAQGRHREIGRHSKLPWNLPEDLAHFQRVTAGARVVMGRPTWESLPTRFRPLPGRENVVLTLRSNFAAPGAVISHSLAEALDHPNVWCIGGADVYAQSMGLVDVIAVTDVDVDVSHADAFAPEIPAEYEEVERTDWFTSTSGIQYRFRFFRRDGVDLSYFDPFIRESKD